MIPLRISFSAAFHHLAVAQPKHQPYIQDVTCASASTCYAVGFYKPEANPLDATMVLRRR